MSSKANGRVAVTGAGGSLGMALVRRLRERGLEVRALARKASQIEALEKLGAKSVKGDLSHDASLADLTAGTEVVFHLAAWINEPFDPAHAHRVNVEGTRRVVHAAAKAGARRVVLASSIAVYGPRLSGTLHEDTEHWSVGDVYGDTKIAAERVAREAASAAGIELSILRPTYIYGPASPPWTVTPYNLIAKRVPMIMGDGEDLLDAVFVDDVAQAFDLAGFHPAAAGEAFNVGHATVTWNKFLQPYADLAGVELRRMPAGLARFGAAFPAGIARLQGKPSRVQPVMIGVLTSRATFPSDKARRMLGYEPAVSLAEGMKRTIEWLRHTGVAKRPHVALVTGAAEGLGSAVARELHARGLEVWAADLRLADLAPLRALGIHTIELDVRSEESIANAVSTVEERSGPIDLLLNNAGINRPGPLEIQPTEDWMALFDTNTFGPLRLARAVAPRMRKRGKGRIVNVSSTNGFIVTPFVGAYSASKHALEALSDALRMELQPWGVEVGVVQPAAMKTKFASRARATIQRLLTHDDHGWHSYLEAFANNSTAWGGEGAATPEHVARIVVDAALAKKLKSRTKPTLDAVAVGVLSHTNDTIKDMILRRTAGLHRPPKRES